MAELPGDLEKVAERMRAALDGDLMPEGRLGMVRRYLEGDHDLPYVPTGARAEFLSMAKTSRQNWLPLVSDTFADSLHVEGYRTDKQRDNADVWAYWQANGMDARQSITHRGVLEYGAAYVGVFKGSPAPVIKPYDVLRSYALFSDEDADYPDFFLYRVGKSALGEAVIFELIDATNVYRLRWTPSGAPGWRLDATSPHGFKVCPVVRFRDRIDGRARGVIAPLKADQDRINEVSFVLHIALHYASFRQRWATGLVIPEVEVTDPDTGEVTGYEAVETFQAAMDRIWTSDSTDTKFGDFAQTDVTGHLKALETAVRTLAARAQISPNIMTGDLSNLSAEALAQLESQTQRRLLGFEKLIGEAWEKVLALAAIADGKTLDTAGAQVRWADTEARALAATVDALGKLATMLSVPVEALWELIPGVSDQDVERWRAMRAEGDPFAAVADKLNTQLATTAAAA